MEIFHNKVVLLGSSSAGKSSLCYRFIDRRFDPSGDPTIGASFMTKKVVLTTGGIMKLDIWDTAGQERYRSLTPMYYRGASAVIIVYDITDEHSYGEAKRWREELDDRVDAGVLAVLVGNKADMILRRVVPTAEASAYAEEHGMDFIETSAKTGDNVHQMFEDIANKLPRNAPGARLCLQHPRVHSKYSYC